MDLVQLEMFVAVAECGNLTNAATHLVRSPSNLTVRIQQLERELGVQLLVRDKRQCTLSADGQAFLEYARRITDLVDDARSFAEPQTPKGRFRLGALESTAVTRIPPLMATFALNYPQVEPEVVATSSGRLLTEVLDGNLTAAFSDGRPTHPALTGVKAFDEDLVMITPIAVDRITEEFRRSQPVAFAFGETCSYRQRFEDWLHAEEIRPARFVEISSYHSILACVAAGAGIGMMPASLLRTMPGHRDVASHRLAGPAGRAETWLMWRRECRSVNLDALTSELRQSNPPSGALGVVDVA